MSTRFYSTSKRTEPDMRAEFNATMDGLYPEIPKAQPLILRKMKRSEDETTPGKGRKQIQDYFVPSEGFLIFCECVDTLTGEPDKDTWCPICQGEGFLWDEIFIDSYKVSLRSDVGQSTKQDLIKPGLTNIPLVIFYTRSSVPLTRADKLVEIWLDEEGKPIRPYRREKLYRIGTSIDFRSDGGKLEYWQMDCFEEQRKFLNGPKEG